MSSKGKYVPIPFHQTVDLSNQKQRSFVPQGWAIRILGGLNIALILVVFRLSLHHKQEVSNVGLSIFPTQSATYKWSTEFSSPNENDTLTVNAAWDAIIPDHGIITLKHEWALKHGLPTSMSLPSDDEKGIYVIDAYHQMHCLKMIRRAFLDSVGGQSPMSTLAHYGHCFDSLRQSIMCTATDNLLYTWGNHHTGEVHLRKCRDWNALRTWATEHTACDPEDTANKNAILRQNLCHGDTDGLPPNINS